MKKSVRRTARLILTFAFSLSANSLLAGEPSRLVSGSVESALVSDPVEYYALLPPDYEAMQEAPPLVFYLHGGDGDRDYLKQRVPLIEEMWARGKLPPMVIVTPSAPRLFYMDTKDGSQKWETFLMTTFLNHARTRFKVSNERRSTMLIGVSMGGTGSLRLAFKYPERFGAVAALEPGIAPIEDWNEMRAKYRFFRDDSLLESVYGTPVDRDYWNANNPVTIARRDAEKLRESGLRIFLEAGDADSLWLYEGAEYLHQLLWDERIRHEYRLYYGADHAGRSLGPRLEQAFYFLGSSLKDPAPDPVASAFRKLVDPLKAPLEEADHYGIDASLVSKEK